MTAEEIRKKSSEELEKELESMAKMYNMELDALKKAFGEANMKYLKEDVVMRKAIDYIYSKAVITDVEDKPAASEEAPADAEKAKAE